MLLTQKTMFLTHEDSSKHQEKKTDSPFPLSPHRSSTLGRRWPPRCWYRPRPSWELRGATRFDRSFGVDQPGKTKALTEFFLWWSTRSFFEKDLVHLFRGSRLAIDNFFQMFRYLFSWTPREGSTIRCAPMYGSVVVDLQIQNSRCF